MNDQTDQQLLRKYLESRSDAAFAELVHRHIDLVYSAALRMVQDSHLAEDVTQNVFVALATDARKLTDRPIIAGWLHRTAQNIAANVVRSDVRRRAREQEAVAMQELMSSETDASWDQIRPELDAALGRLNESDREALLLRYFQRKSAREMAETLGVSEEAAQKRVNRAGERLRNFLSQRGIAAGAGALGLVISANAVHAAPVTLTTTVLAAASVAGAGVAATATAAHTIFMTTTQKIIWGTFVVGLLGAGIYEAQRASRLENRLSNLELRQKPMEEQLRQLTRDRDEATNKLAASKQENELLRRQVAGLPKMRGEMARLQHDSKELAQVKERVAAVDGDDAQTEMKSWLMRVQALKQRFEQAPEAKIPEFQFLTEQDWLNATKGELNDEKDYRKAMSLLRGEAEGKFVGMLRPALKKFMVDHQSEFPGDISELRSYFEPPVDGTILQRYSVVPASEVPSLGMGGNSIITQKSLIDTEYDQMIGVGPNGAGTCSYNPQEKGIAAAAKILAPVTESYKAANNGKEPVDPLQVIPYLKTPEQRAAYDQMMAYRASAEKKAK